MENLNELEELIMKKLERLKGNSGCDYLKNCHISDCMSEIRKIFKEINNGK